MASITSPGVGSGLDINSLVTQIVAAEGEPATVRLNQEEARFQTSISGLGSLKSALSDFQSSVAKLTSLSDFQKRSASSDDTAFFTASADASATAGTFAIEVVSLASSQKLVSSGYTDTASDVGSGTLTISTGGKSFDVSVSASAKTVSDVRDAINDASNNTGVSATIINVDDGSGGTESKLVLSADTTGIANKITVTVADDDGNNTDAAGLSNLAYDTGAAVTNLSELQPAADAQIKVNQQTITRATNSISDAIEGVTLNLVKVNTANETKNLTVSLDKSAGEKAVNDFVSAYNSLRETMAALSTFNPETGERGALLGDATLLGVGAQLRREMGAAISGVNKSFNSLAAIGITTNSDGSMAVDSDVLSAAIDKDFDSVGNVFASSDGVAVRVDAILSGFLESDGVIDSRVNGLNGSIDGINDQRDTLSRRLAALEQRTLAQFIAMDALVGQLRSTGNFLTQQFSALQAVSGNSK